MKLTRGRNWGADDLWKAPMPCRSDATPIRPVYLSGPELAGVRVSPSAGRGSGAATAWRCGVVQAVNSGPHFKPDPATIPYRAQRQQGTTDTPNDQELLSPLPRRSRWAR